MKIIDTLKMKIEIRLYVIILLAFLILFIFLVSRSGDVDGVSDGVPTPNTNEISTTWSNQTDLDNVSASNDSMIDSFFQMISNIKRGNQ